MTHNFGQANGALRKAIRRIASSGDTHAVRFLRHAEFAMDDDGFDHKDVMVCLRRGMAFGPEVQNGQVRANVIHRGLHIRVVVGWLDVVNGNWDQLNSITVVTVMEAQ